MIFYFSGTGNSRWAAQQLAALTGDEAKDIAALKAPPSLAREKQLGLVFPIYAWGAPEPVVDFVKKLEKTSVFSFAVCTCGEEAGHAMKKLASLYPFRSSYSLVMPNNYVIGSDVDDESTARRKIDQAYAEIQTIAREISQQKAVCRVQEGTHPGLKSSLVNFGFNRFARTTKDFYTTDSCNGCGLCAKNCPAGTISMEKGRPVWGKTCYQCLRCINECPRQAIQYGKATETRGRYTIDRYLDKTGSPEGKKA